MKKILGLLLLVVAYVHTCLADKVYTATLPVQRARLGIRPYTPS